MGYTTKRHWLEIAEYVSLAGSALSTVAAAVSQQLVYVSVTAPLTLAVFCNIINRQRSQQLYQQQTHSLVADIRSGVECLHQQIHSPSNTPNPQPLHQAPVNCTDFSVTSPVEPSVRTWAIPINQHLEHLKPDDYCLVTGCSGSRAVLMEALEKTQQRLIIVSPWLTQSSINGEVVQGFAKALERRVSIHIGWGHLSDRGWSKPSTINRQQFLKAIVQKNQGWKYNALPELEQLEQRYLGQFRLKLLFTPEKFLVSVSPTSAECTNSFALLGSHNILTWDGNSKEREVGLRTNDPRLISDLIARFDQAANYDSTSWGVSKQPLEAIAAYRSIVEIESGSAIAYSQLAGVLMSQGKLAEAIAAYRKLLQLEPRNSVAYASLGNALFAQGNQSEALATYQKALKIDPSYTYAYNNIGRILENAGNLFEALLSYRQALKQPEQLGKPASAHALAHNNAGVVLAKLGKLRDAIGEFQQAIALDSHYTEARTNLKKAQLLLN
ncbi:MULTISPECIES: tetratricopeptide repeat protein [unclassified Coleofasciculus]|uniref:tetratricopeptide repeat protein n=1 Tax=unclassified Coleofasciculus TaxID=2692782 RepID=UPI0018814FB3|nr:MULTISPECIES: tetratricopeptide repeat protein [unclassified Coleofasciculus]MBE9125423.1 tetratricopeptide repeat protein [Coleofasciculus sp. LEGE 07081]MBE9147109.1 tetratricopeptide repeat protein [Coleofasciculus sp. LEGE 07092]